MNDSVILELFRQEVPEIDAGVVEIRAVARLDRIRTRIAVRTSRPGIDPVAVCVGPEGRRVNRVVASLYGERVDIVNWHGTPERRLRNALAPLRINQVDFPAPGVARVLVSAESRAELEADAHLVPMAVQLAGWDIRIEVTPTP